MSFTVLNLYKDKWVLSSAARAIGGGTIDVPPVRLISIDQIEDLAKALRILINEDHPTVPAPDWNDSRFKVGIRAEAVGAKTWSAFTKFARAFKLERTADGLVLEEWPKHGRSFSASPSWKKRFPRSEFATVARHLIRVAKRPPGMS
jgi:hypothetical protein